MIRALTYRVKEELVRTILNTIYAIFLGFLFTNVFHRTIDPSTENVRSVKFLIDAKNVLPVCLLSFYFLLDWLTANLTLSSKKKVGINHFYLMLIMALICYLGGMIILAFAPERNLYLLFAVYATLVPWWDILTPSLPDPLKQSLSVKLWISFIMLLRLVVGLFMLVVVLLNFLRPASDFEAVYHTLHLSMSVLVAAKFFRYLFFLHHKTSGV